VVLVFAVCQLQYRLMKVNMLHPHGPSEPYVYPSMPHILWLPESAILAKVSPDIAADSTYTLTSEETK
jgi:hypothetical protein